jgi:nickel-dependent lactate racemase
MDITVPYLDRLLPLRIADEELMAVIEPNAIEASDSPVEILRRALGVPTGNSVAADQPTASSGGATAGGVTSGGATAGTFAGATLAEFLAGAGSVLIIVNDATRPTPTPLMLDSLLPGLWAAGIGTAGITILVATGAHRAPTEPEYRQILGAHYQALRRQCLAHDARNQADLVELGVTSRGTTLTLNRLLFQSDCIIVTGSVEPHYFAGFTGGRKAFLPGVAGFHCIEHNHRLALLPSAQTLALDGNPVHEDMQEALALLRRPVFALMTVLDKDQRIVAACAGDPWSSFDQAVAHARRIFCVKVPAKADVVVSVARFPMDIDLYQSHKAIENGAMALRDGGTLILVSACRDGLGDPTFADLLASAASPQAVLEKLAGTYRLGYHKAGRLAAVLARVHVAAITQLDPSRLRSMFIQPATVLQDAVDAAMARARAGGVRQPRLLVLADGCVTVPDCLSTNLL